MKKPLILFFIFLIMEGALLFSCSDDSDSPAAGREDLLEGAWWINNPYQDDGAYFDGIGNGYDISGEYPDALYVECDDPLTYTYDGLNFSKTEGGITINGTFILNNDGAGGILTVTILGVTYNLTVEKIDIYAIVGDCLD